MAQLNFTQNGLAWISDEISVSSDFNLHIERENVQQFPYVVELGNMFIKEVQAVR